MTTSGTGPNPFLTVWAEHEDIDKLKIPELGSEAEVLHKARASMELGFPPITMMSAMKGGVPPWGRDHNGILRRITEAIRWIQAGGATVFNQELCDKIGGYPRAAILRNEKDPTILWFSAAENNTFNPVNETDSVNGVERKRNTYWKKLDFLGLEERLKGILDSILSINKEKLPAKADLNGSCNTLFNASNMSAKKYSFCTTQYTQNTSFEEIQGEVKLYTDIAYRVYVKDSNKAILSVEKSPYKLISMNTDQVSITATQWVSIVGKTSVDGEISFRKIYYTKDGGSLDTTLSWLLSVDYFDASDPMNPDNSKDKLDGDDEPSVYTKDWLITLVDTNPATKKSFEALRISYDNGDVVAHGAFVNGGADLAEYYRTDSRDYEPGTLMCHGIDTEVVLCKSIEQTDDFFGVISTKPGYVMNGKGKEEDYSVLIALNGKVPVKVKGVVKCGDKITIGQDGHGVVSKSKNDVIIGRAKEDKVIEDVGLVSCYVQARL